MTERDCVKIALKNAGLKFAVDWACQSRRAAGPSSNQFVKRFTVRLLIQNDEATTNRADVRKQACRDQIAIIADINEACTLSFRMLLC